MIRRPPRSPLFPSPPLFRSGRDPGRDLGPVPVDLGEVFPPVGGPAGGVDGDVQVGPAVRLAPATVRLLPRSEEHTSELQSRLHLVCRLLLEKKKKIYNCDDM